MLILLSIWIETPSNTDILPKGSCNNASKWYFTSNLTSSTCSFLLERVRIPTILFFLNLYFMKLWKNLEFESLFLIHWFLDFWHNILSLKKHWTLNLLRNLQALITNSMDRIRPSWGVQMIKTIKIRNNLIHVKIKNAQSLLVPSSHL